MRARVLAEDGATLGARGGDGNEPEEEKGDAEQSSADAEVAHAGVDGQRGGK